MITIPLQVIINAGSQNDGSSSPTSSKEILRSLMQDVNAAKDSACTVKKKAEKRPKGFLRKDVMIERNIKFLLKHNQNLSVEDAKEQAIRRYEAYIDTQREKSRLRSQEHRKVKEFVRRIDPNLAKMVTRDPPTKKIHFIARKEAQIKREHVGIQHPDASKMAQKMYDDLVEDRKRRQNRFKEAKKQKNIQTGRKKQ
ncbi:uncharacterized protein FA14DRAFT_177791 [Meira miltonrushii]|uniref:Uncharacterized protein n=1 Tax=Meira miltonrushii TaxID=1280837 RepID=A0A316VLX6_9BASI|nr:uncharacterized protein FA14DRAFT_177791 [Meira miltonrushii]PWN38527.1 hypothetical protein FA14DRAFT_177791 [Meira miltonrushii]